MPVGRRAVLALLVCAVVLAGAGVVAAAVHDNGESNPLAESVTTTTVPKPGETSTSVDPGATTTSTPPPAGATTSTPPTTVRGATTTTATGRTTVPPTTTTRPVATSTTVNAKPACTSAQIEVTAASDRASYLPAEPATITSTIRNRSSSTCYYLGYTFGVAFTDAAGHPYGGQSLVADVLEETALAPGQRLTHTVPWDHRQCPVTITCGPLPSGTYTATVTWVFPGGPYLRTVPIVLA
jgi:hypothetical protein